MTGKGLALNNPLNLPGGNKFTPGEKTGVKLETLVVLR